MDMDEYQDKALKSAVYPSFGSNLVYPALKLAGEAGEVAEKIGKKLRSAQLLVLSDKQLTGEERSALLKELGDVLWYISALSRELNCTLHDVAEMNIQKVASQVNRGVVIGEGDDR